MIMLISEKIKQTKFSKTEQQIIDYIAANQQAIREDTAVKIAQDTYTVPSTLTVVAKKLGYKGWAEFRKAYLDELDYMNSHFNEIDANLPFTKNDNIMTIMNKIAALTKEAIDDTISLIDHDTLQKAVYRLAKASSIILFGSSNNCILCREFQYKMARINRRVDLCVLDGEELMNAYTCNPSMAAMLVSYTGENQDLLAVLDVLKEHHIPTVAITSIGDNSISRGSDITLHMCTREKMYSKIASYTSNTSITFILDTLYSCIFSLDYDKNLETKIEIHHHTDKKRKRRR